MLHTAAGGKASLPSSPQASRLHHYQEAPEMLRHAGTHHHRAQLAFVVAQRQVHRRHRRQPVAGGRRALGEGLTATANGFGGTGRSATAREKW